MQTKSQGIVSAKPRPWPARPEPRPPDCAGPDRHPPPRYDPRSHRVRAPGAARSRATHRQHPKRCARRSRVPGRSRIPTRASLRSGPYHRLRRSPGIDRWSAHSGGLRCLRWQRGGGAGFTGKEFLNEVPVPDLLQEIEEQIEGLKRTAERQNVGVIREIGDGVAKIEGLSDAMLNEMIDLGHGITGL